MTLPPLKYIGGHPALDLVNTVDWTGDGLRAERLPGYARWLEWGAASGIVTPPEAERLAGAARRDPGAAARALARVRRTRGLLRRLLGNRARGRPPADEDLRRFNALLRRALARLQLAFGRRGAVLRWRDLGGELDGPLWPVVWEAAQLLASGEADRIRICAGRDCGWMYLDRSRNGLRRWCEMSTCGTREKNRRRAYPVRPEPG